jgi:hypothetical protein
VVKEIVKQDVIDLPVFVHGIKIHVCQASFPILIEATKAVTPILGHADGVIPGKVGAVPCECLDEGAHRAV